MEGKRKDLINWLTEHGRPNILTSTITFYRENHFLDDCIVEKPEGSTRKTKTVYDVERAGRRILWIKEKQERERLTLEEIKALIKKDPEKALSGRAV